MINSTYYATLMSIVAKLHRKNITMSYIDLPSQCMTSQVNVCTLVMSTLDMKSVLEPFLWAIILVIAFGPAVRGLDDAFKGLFGVRDEQENQD